MTATENSCWPIMTQVLLFFCTQLPNCCFPLIFPFHCHRLTIVVMLDIFIDLTFLTTARTKVICLNCRRYHELTAHFYYCVPVKWKDKSSFLWVTVLPWNILDRARTALDTYGVSIRGWQTLQQHTPCLQYAAVSHWWLKLFVVHNNAQLLWGRNTITKQTRCSANNLIGFRHF